MLIHLRSTKRFMLLITIFLVAIALVGCKTPNDEPEEFDYTDLSVRDYISENGSVAAANPYAAKAGLDILKAGGNAFDAAVAMSFALGVVEPNATGLGGGGIMVAYDASAGEYISYNFREFVPAAGDASAYPNGAADLDYGPLSCGVPTQVAGLVTIQEERGVKTRQEVMQPAIDFAKDGVPVTPELANNINDCFYIIMDSRSETRDVYTSDGITPLAAGELLVQPDLAHTLQLISEQGLEGFYKGEVAMSIVNTLAKQGGIMTLADLEYAMNNYPIVETPVQGTYHGYDVISATTPSSGGIILLEALNMLEVYGDVSKLDHNSVDYINVVATAMQLAYGDKRKYIADSKFVDVPIQGLLSKAYAEERWEKFNPSQAYLGRFIGDDDFGNPWPYQTNIQNTAFSETEYDEHFSTTTFSAADKDGNIVSVTQTINHFFGNGIVPEGTGFFLNNQLSSFTLTSTSASYVKPYKQPVSHIMPTIIMKDGNPYATLGSPGSMRIPAAVLQVILNMIDFGMDIQTAINTPRFYSYACASTDLSSTSKDIYVERALYNLVKDGLSAMNYNVIVQGSGDIDLYFGGVQGIRFIYEEGKLHGGADPRRDGKALGY
ncbi:MAG: gamma-glutamyltransferase [Bacilli bacterium]|nr:gamma-glutamyltransferase [Bacilli bacterium]